jgi:hypothetical protein
LIDLYDSGNLIQNEGRGAPLFSVGTGGGPVRTQVLRPNVSKDGDTNVLNAALGTCGTAASYGQYKNVLNGTWRGANGKMYNMNWGGNGATGARALAIGRANSFNLLSKSMGILGAGFSGYQSYQAYQQGNKGAAAKAGLDGTMAIVGAFGGPHGAAASALYFIGDAVGWNNVIPPRHCSTVNVAPVSLIRATF